MGRRKSSKRKTNFAKVFSIVERSLKRKSKTSTDKAIFQFFQKLITITDSTGIGATASAILSGQIGYLRSYYILTSTGEKIVINDNIGKINYTTGRINLYNFKPISISNNPNYASGTLTINISPQDKTIHPLRNRLLSIDSGDPIAIQVTMENEA